MGKSQLARAAAKALGRAFVHRAVDARTEAQDLLWHFDAVGRLAEAQLAGALKDVTTLYGQARLHRHIRSRLAVCRYLHPGSLWWALNWKDAAEQAERGGLAPPAQRDGGDPDNGVVVLIDEIDKAEPELPNGLLEALGAGEFLPPGRHEPVRAAEPAPLVIITSNEERALPDAFLRRCLVLHLTLPDNRAALIAHLTERGRAHFSGADPGILTTAAKQLADDRDAAREAHWTPLPGQAEYLDLLRAVLALAPGDPARQEKVLKSIAQYVLNKRAGAV
ncbi:AAA family ATPase [Azospirillum brasilense]|uniref:AAA family ATPase n=1 Tax=Azospirillum brasilense TaxID=192 RepID=UPI001FFF0D96|nr:AAA family ATPase [Azospirillum brasilense]